MKTQNKKHDRKIVEASTDFEELRKSCLVFLMFPKSPSCSREIDFAVDNRHFIQPVFLYIQ